MSRDMVLRPDPGALDLLAPDPLADLAIANVQELINGIGDGSISLRRAKRIVEAAGTACDFADALRRIVGDGAGIARMSATCARDVKKLGTEIDDLQTKQAENAVTRAEAEARQKAIGQVVAEEMGVRERTAKLQNKRLQQQLDALDAEAAQKEQPPPPPPAAQPGRFSARIPDITDATLERLSADAARIVREVQAGAIPTGVAQPFHAFAGCLYLRAQLDGQASREAAMSARGELISHMLDGADFSPSQIRAFAKEYEALKRQLRERTEQNRGQSLLSSLHKLGVPTIPRNGSGNGDGSTAA